ncbi:MAG TPA: DNA-binding protein [Deltaproteobacteria bacterium]|nr:DNA-binding protein [Deltaproteobacteria bacterium]
MAAKKKAVAKKTTKKAPAKKAVSARKITAVKKPMSKSAIINELTQNTQLNKKQVSSVLDELAILIEHHIKKRAVGQFTLPGLMKIEVKKRPATKKREGRNPRTGEKMIIKAKPAHRVVKIKPLKKVKDMIG